MEVTQRIKVMLDDKEYRDLKFLMLEETSITKKVEKTIVVKSNKGEETVKLIFRKKMTKIIGIDIVSDNFCFNVNGKLKKMIFALNVGRAMGVFRLTHELSKENVLININQQYKKGGYYPDESDYKINKIRLIVPFELIDYENVINSVSYSDFSNEEDMVSTLYSYIVTTGSNNPVEMIIARDIISVKLEAFGYERSTWLKNSDLSLTEAFKKQVESFKSKKDVRSFLRDVMIEIFYRLIEDEDTNALECAIYTIEEYLK